MLSVVLLEVLQLVGRAIVPCDVSVQPQRGAFHVSIDEFTRIVGVRKAFPAVDAAEFFVERVQVGVLDRRHHVAYFLVEVLLVAVLPVDSQTVDVLQDRTHVAGSCVSHARPSRVHT